MWNDLSMEQRIFDYILNTWQNINVSHLMFVLRTQFKFTIGYVYIQIRKDITIQEKR